VGIFISRRIIAIRAIMTHKTNQKDTPLMAVAQPARPRRPTFQQRVRNYIQATFMRGDVTALIVTCALMMVPALALSRVLSVPRTAGSWYVGLEPLVIVAAASVIFGFLLARSHYGEISSLLLSGVYAFTTIAIIQYLAAQGNPITRVGALADRVRAAISGGQDPFLLIVFMSILFWFLGHNTAWHVFRIDRIWRALLPPGIVLLINGLYSFSGGALNLDPYLIAFLFFAIILFIRSHLDNREYEWYTQQIRYDTSLRIWVLRVGAIVGAVLVIGAWTFPTGSAEQNQKRFQQFVNGEVFTSINRLLSRLFSPLDGQNLTSSDYYGRDELQLGGAIQLGDQIVMLVKATPAPNLRYYWKSRSFDTYSNGLWKSIPGNTYSSTNNLLEIPIQYEYGSRTEVLQTISIVTGPTRLIYAAPQVVRVGLNSEVEANIIDPKLGTLNTSVIRPKSALQDGASYSVLSAVSVAEASRLRLAANPPADAWLAPYRTIDPSIAPRTARELTRQITLGAATNYDRAKAIERWLRTNIKYNETIQTPPTGRDLVDWVLFEQKQAYCTYYATAMVVMLRQLGIPARVAAGFSQGVYDPSSQSYIVRERDAHTWVEVYFPGAGWVEFEPTSAQDEVGRGETSRVTPTPQATSAPLATETPLPTATQPNQPNQPNPPTPTPMQITATSNAPTPTPQTVIAPPPPPRTSDAEASWLGPLLGVLAIISGIIGLIVFIGIGIFWWVEYRGLDRLSPVGRAYARLGLYAKWLRIPLEESSTPLERGRRIVKEVGDDPKPIATITDMYIYERYGPPRQPTAADEIRANRAWNTSRWVLLRRWRRGNRSAGKGKK
jgi:transglutaminase-like putative cysteine protease